MSASAPSADRAAPASLRSPAPAARTLRGLRIPRAVAGAGRVVASQIVTGGAAADVAQPFGTDKGHAVRCAARTFVGVVALFTSRATDRIHRGALGWMLVVSLLHTLLWTGTLAWLALTYRASQGWKTIGLRIAFGLGAFIGIGTLTGGMNGARLGGRAHRSVATLACALFLASVARAAEPLILPDRSTPTLSATWLEFARGTMPGRLSVAGGHVDDDIDGTWSGALLTSDDGQSWIVDGGASERFDEERASAHGMERVLLALGSRGWTTTSRPKAMLAALGVRPMGAILTHAHFDHVGGLLDVPDLAIHVGPGEVASAIPAEQSRLAPRAVTIPWEPRPFLGYDPSWRPFGDDRLVVVPMAGHTVGSVGVYAHLAGDRHVLLIGDTAWLREGVSTPAPRSRLAQRFDTDAAQVLTQLRHLHALQAALPSLQIVPAHDRRAWVEIFGAPASLRSTGAD